MCVRCGVPTIIVVTLAFLKGTIQFCFENKKITTDLW